MMERTEWVGWNKYKDSRKQGPPNQRIKGSRVRCYNVTVGQIRKLVKGMPGVKKIHIIDAGVVEIIHTCTKDSWRRLWNKLKDNNINITGEDKIYG